MTRGRMKRRRDCVTLAPREVAVRFSSSLAVTRRPADCLLTFVQILLTLVQLKA
jgi:hypothetical protein